MTLQPKTFSAEQLWVNYILLSTVGQLHPALHFSLLWDNYILLSILGIP